jgi:hypothetical protein
MHPPIHDVIPDAAVSAFTRVFDALWRRSGVHTACADNEMLRVMDSGFTRFARAPE